MFEDLRSGGRRVSEGSALTGIQKLSLFLSYLYVLTFLSGLVRSYLERSSGSSSLCFLTFSVLATWSTIGSADSAMVDVFLGQGVRWQSYLLLFATTKVCVLLLRIAFWFGKKLTVICLWYNRI